MDALLGEFNKLTRATYDSEFLETTGLPVATRNSLESLKGHELHRLKRQILTDLFPDYFEPWEEHNPDFLPDGSELSRFLAGRAEFPSLKDEDLTDLAKTASFMVETSARRTLRRYLHDFLDRDYPPCPIHTYLAELSATLPEDVPLVIVTTNYDDLLERAFEQVERERAEKNLPTRPYDIVIHPSDYPELAASVLVWRHGADKPVPAVPRGLHLDLKRTILYKMHGTVVRKGRPGRSGLSTDERDDSYVITEEDYVEFLSRMTYQTPIPSVLMKHFSRRHFLFLGYGLNDWNLRVMLRNLRGLPVAAAQHSDTKANAPAAVGSGNLPAEDGTGAPAQADTGQENGSVSDDLKSWAIQFKPTDLEKRLWNARDVNIYDVDINAFVTGLSNAVPVGARVPR